MDDRIVVLFDALLITIAVIIVGIIINRVADSFRLNVVLSNMNNDNLEQESLFLQKQLYILSQNKNGYLCSHVDSILNEYKKSISKYGDSLETYGQIANSYKRVYKLIQDDYYISQLYFYNSVKMLNEICGSKVIPLIFVYKPNAESSLLQGYTLENLEKTYKNVFVVSLSLNFSARMHISNSTGILFDDTKLPLIQTDTKLIKLLNLTDADKITK